MSHAVVVGAGITGLAAAWALIRRGWTAEVLEAGPIPNPEAASADAHRLIRSHYAGQPGYAARIPEAFAAWEALWRDLGARHYVPRGILALSRKAGDWTERAGEALAAAGQPHEVLGANEAAARFPTFEMAGVRFALFTEGGGALLADRILAGLRGWLTAQGTVLRPHRAATGVDPAAGRVETAAG
ncbi:MAG: FAD-dependent oxidoreductase, partial [Pseudomonadota bacterium]